MIKTFIRRWYITNKLYHFQIRRNGIRWVDQGDFVAWLNGVDIQTVQVLNASQEMIPDPEPRLLSAPFSWFFDARNRDDLHTEIRNIIQECADNDVNYIKNYNDKGRMYLNLSARGREIYSVSYLFFGHPYARTIWTGVIVAVVGWFIINQLQSLNRPGLSSIQLVEPSYYLFD